MGYSVRSKKSAIEDLVLRTKVLKWSSFHTKGLICPNCDISSDLRVFSSTINEELEKYPQASCCTCISWEMVFITVVP